jgi:hypothetical protein
MMRILNFGLVQRGIIALTYLALCWFWVSYVHELNEKGGRAFDYVLKGLIIFIGSVLVIGITVLSALIWTEFLQPIQRIYNNFTLPPAMYQDVPRFQQLSVYPMFSVSTLLLFLGGLLLVYGFLMVRAVKKIGIDGLRLGTLRRNLIIFGVMFAMTVLQFAFNCLELPFSDYYSPPIQLIRYVLSQQKKKRKILTSVSFAVSLVFSRFCGFLTV